MRLIWAWVLVGGAAAAQTAADLNDEAARHHARGELEIAERLYRRALEQVGGDPLMEAAITGNLAAVVRRQDRYAEAEQLYSRALRLRERMLGPSHAEVAVSLNNLAEIYRIEGRYADAGTLLERARRTLESAGAASDLAIVLHNLADLRLAQADLGAAERLLRQSLDLEQRCFGPDHREVASTLNTLARVRERVGDWSGAERLLQRALEIWASSERRPAQEWATALTNLGRLYGLEKRYVEAEDFERRALSALTAAGQDRGSVAAAVLSNWAALRAAQDRFAEAAELFGRARAISEALPGPSHASLVPLYRENARVLRHLGRKSEARELERCAQRLTGSDKQPDLAGLTVDFRALLR